MSGKRTTILIVDDNEDLASMLATYMQDEPDIACVGTLHAADTLLDTIGDKGPDIVLMDLTMPGRDPLETMAEAVAKYPASRFIILSGYDDTALVDKVVDRGAWGFVSKHADVQRVVRAIRTVAAGKLFLNTGNA